MLIIIHIFSLKEVMLRFTSKQINSDKRRVVKNEGKEIGN